PSLCRKVNDPRQVQYHEVSRPNREPVGVVPCDASQRGFDIGWLPHFDRPKGKAKRARRRFRMIVERREAGEGRVPDDRDSRNLRHRLLEQLYLLAAELGRLNGHPSDISAGTGEARDEPVADWIDRSDHHDWNRGGRLSSSKN